MKYFEIGQDGLGFISKMNNEYIGIGTQGLDTCMAIIIELDTGFILLHDTGEIDLQTFCNFVQSKGTVINADSYEMFKKTPGREEKMAQQRNKNRRVQIKKILGFKNTFWQRYTETGKVYINIKGEVTTDDVVETEKPYLYEKRHKINVINNFFEQDTKNIPPDIQFDDEINTGLPELIHSELDIKNEINRLYDTNSAFYAQLGEKLLDDAKRENLIFPSGKTINADKSEPLNVDKGMQLIKEAASKIDKQTIDALYKWLNEE